MTTESQICSGWKTLCWKRARAQLFPQRCQGHHKPTPHSATSTHLFKPCRDDDTTTSLGSLCRWLIICSVRKYFLTANLNLLRQILRPFPLVPSLATWCKSQIYTSPTASCQGVLGSDKVSPRLLFSRLKNPSLLRHSSLTCALHTSPAALFFRNKKLWNKIHTY